MHLSALSDAHLTDIPSISIARCVLTRQIYRFDVERRTASVWEHSFERSDVGS